MLTTKEIKDIVEDLAFGKSKHVFYAKSQKIADNIKEAFSEEYPKWMDKARPKEPKNIRKYRKEVFENPARGEATRINDKIIKIEQADGFSVTYPKDAGETNPLEEYCDKTGFFGHNNLVNYMFTSGGRTGNYDPNAVMAVLDKRPSMSETEPRKPFPHLFSCRNVLMYVMGVYCVLEEDGRPIGEKVYYILDDTNYYILQETRSGGFTMTTVAHGETQMPATKLGQYIEEQEKGEILYRSILSDTLPHFRSAIRRFNDIEVELNHHINTKEWSIAPKKCKSCGGKGIMATKDDPSHKCETCNGNGFANWNELEDLLIEPEDTSKMFGDGKFPFSSPAGQVARDVGALKAMREAFVGHLDDAYNAIDFGILRSRRSNSAESEASKRMDRLEYGQRIYSAARHIVENLLLPAYRSIEAQLFAHNPTLIGKYVPLIQTPMEFDLQSTEAILEEIKKGIDAETDPTIRIALQIRYAKLTLGEDARETKNLTDRANLDPLLGKTSEELTLLMGGGDDSVNSVVDRLDVIISVNLKGFLDRALRENANWDALDYTKKTEIIRAYGQEILDKKTVTEDPDKLMNAVREEMETEDEPIETAA